MLKALFLPSGTTNRVRFALYTLGFWGFGLGLLAVGTLLLKSLGPPSAKTLPILYAMYGATGLICLTLLWCYLVLWIQRLRDMGWRPWLSLAVAMTAHALEEGFHKRMFGVEELSLTGLAFYLALIAWPSCSEAGPKLTARTTSAYVPVPRRGQFGLRGA